MRAIFRVIFNHFAMTYGVEYPLKVQIVILGFFIRMMSNAIIPGVYRPDDVLDIHTACLHVDLILHGFSVRTRRVGEFWKEVTREAFRLRRAAAIEEAADAAAIDRAWADDAAGETIPGDVVKAILDGEPPLRVWRKYRAFTLDALARRVGVSKGYLSQIESGQKPGTLGLFRRLAEVLDVSMDELVGWKEEGEKCQR